MESMKLFSHKVHNSLVHCRGSTRYTKPNHDISKSTQVFFRVRKSLFQVIQNAQIVFPAFGKSSLLLGAESLTILNYILQHMLGVQPIPEKHDPFLFANERIRLSQINQRSQISKKMCSCLNFWLSPHFILIVNFYPWNCDHRRFHFDDHHPRLSNNGSNSVVPQSPRHLAFI